MAGTITKDTTEIYWGLNFDLPFTPSIMVYHDVDEAEGSYVSFALGHTIEKIAELGADIPVGIDIGASLGWGSGSYNKYYWGTDQSKLNDLTFSVSFPFEIAGWTIAPGLNYVTLVSDDIRATDTYGTDSDFFFTGVVAKENIRSLLDLKGKRIAVQEGTIAHFTVLKALENAGLDQTEVQLANLDLEALQQAFVHNEVDAAAIYEPYMSNLAHQGKGHIIFSSREIPRAICDVLFVKDQIAREHPDVIDHWIEAWNDALNFKGNEPETYLHALNRLNGTPTPDLKKSFEGIFFTNLAENRMAFGTPERPGYLLESLREMEKFMLEQEVIQQHPELQDLIEFGGIQRFFNK